ncbi:hypothetical protein [Photobacterium lutimaris]|uniref:Uncharacterized protein n=1 Tax=Photobacterium lutimaris TaxID=388278 RepID=A0A2T3IHU8_9GAMM|nr:hypothetical protein [Photobacterium lutimaris]PSU27861.1 hypothetical protein C9I99_26645 [Photobacterium lutimaris]TDR69925.1 hypothetical protein DFP78_12711 [Photobacterium lutimaris]
MKTIRVFHRHFNPDTTAKGIAIIAKILGHTLRILSQKAKPPEWDESLAKENLLWFDGKTASLDDYNLEQKQAILAAIMPAPKVKNQAKLKTRRRQLKAKIKKAMEVERQKGHEDAAELLRELWTTSDNCPIPAGKVAQLDMKTLARHQQKMGTVRKFVDVHNKLTGARPNQNATYLQEGIIKIPHRWNVDNKTITPQDWLDFTEKFLTHYFPTYPIHAMAVHADERLKNEETGTHCHYFLSGQDSVFGNWDLLKTQIEVVNQYVREQNKLRAESEEKEEELLPENCVLTQAQMVLHGERLQAMFRDFINEHLLHKRGFHAEIAPETERQSEEGKKMNRQVKMPKSKRSHNYATRKCELEEKRLEKLKLATKEVASKLADLETAKAQLDHDIAKKKEEVADQELALKSLSFECCRLSTMKAKLKGELRELLGEMIREAYIGVAYQQRGLVHQAEDYFQRLAEQLDSELSLDLQPVVHSIIHAVGDEPCDTSPEDCEVGYD